MNNMVQGVTEGFQKELELQGVGYRAQLQGKKLNLSLGFLILWNTRRQRESK